MSMHVYIIILYHTVNIVKTSVFIDILVNILSLEFLRVATLEMTVNITIVIAICNKKKKP